MTLDGFTEQEIKLLHDLVLDKLEDLEISINEQKIEIYRRSLYKEQDTVNIILTNTETNEQIEETSEQLVERMIGWQKEYQDLLDKISPYLILLKED